MDFDQTSKHTPSARSARGFAFVLLRVLGLFALLLAGCASSLPYTWVQEMPASEGTPDGAPRQIGDTVTVFVREQESLSGDFKVRHDGTFAQPIVGAVHAAGRTTEQVAAAVRDKLRGILTQPEVSVAVAERRPVRVGVIGEVRSPGHFEVAADDGVLGLLARAGGLNDFANEDKIYVIRREPELRRVRMRYRELMTPENAAARFRLLDGDTIVVE